MNPSADLSCQAARSPAPCGFSWKRFWIQSLLAILAFNVLAAWICWAWVLPALFGQR